MKNTSPPLTENDIRRLAGSDVFFRGRDYFLERRVSGVQFVQGILSAEVQGNGRLPYQVKAQVNAPDDVQCQCTCPYMGDMCKHAVAVLLAGVLHVQQDAVPKTPKPVASKYKKSLLFAKEYDKKDAPVIRLMLETSSNFGNSPKGYAVDTAVIYQGRTINVASVAQLIDREDYRFVRNASLPDAEEFNPAQMHALRLIHSFTEHHDTDHYLKAHELSLLLSTVHGEGIEFYEGKSKPLTIRRDATISLIVEIAKSTNNKFQACLYLPHPDDATQSMKGVLVQGRPCWFINFEQGLILPFDAKIDERILAKVFALNDSTVYAKTQVLKFKQTILDPIAQHVRIIDRDHMLDAFTVEEFPLNVELHLEGNGDKIIADIHFIYDEAMYTLKQVLEADAYLPRGREGYWIKRNLAEERSVVDFLFKRGFVLDQEDNAVLKGMDAIAAFAFEHLPKFAAKYKVVYAPGFEEQFKSKSILRPQINFGSSELDWFYFDISFIAEGIAEEFSNAQIQKQLLQGKNYIRLKSGAMVPIDRAAFKPMEELSAEFDGKTKKLSLFHAPYVLEETNRLGLSTVFHGNFKEVYDRLKAFRTIETVEPPLHLKGTLRDYQTKGLDWLEFLREFHFGGILADEMGLGKTVQVLSLLARQMESGENLPHLVVCPTTLVWNWQEEIKKFYPDFKILIPQGPDRREQIKNVKDYNVIITSYALLRRDAEYYSAIKFNYVVLDEAQNIKNRNTLNARMSKELNSQHRLVLTGTPMENSVADLWSIFDFLMPGFLGGYERFKSRYETPILKESSKEAMEALGLKIKPFLMRRLKKEVMKELPEKIEQVSYCVLEPTQLKTYEQMLILARKQVTDAYTKQGFNKSRMQILTVILRLRQICCHPELAHVTLGHRLAVSAKLNLLKEIVGEVISGGHKVLIFSQFVGMLEIIAEYFKKEKIVFEFMDGKTKDRQECVERFNNTESTKVFLLSLKVGGVGLNLTSADTVILYEPWWNPAVEDQAIDRAHRIGQKNTVTAYKLICKGTIEEKILELQKRKKNIIDSLVVSEEGIAKSIGWEDIKFLLDI